MPNKVREGFERAGRFAKDRPDSVKKLQDFAKSEVERDRNKKKPSGVITAPSDSLMRRVFGKRTKPDINLPLKGSKYDK